MFDAKHVKGIPIISIFLASKVCPMLKYSDIYEPMAIVIFN